MKPFCGLMKLKYMCEQEVVVLELQLINLVSSDSKYDICDGFKRSRFLECLILFCCLRITQARIY